jgi:hypothetical protein
MTTEQPEKSEHQYADVTALMEAIRRLIRESGGAVPTAEEEEAAVAGRLEALITETRIRPTLLEEMRLDGEQWNLTGQFTMDSHRVGIIGRTVGWVKKVMRRFGVMLGNPLVYRQAEINTYLRTVVHHLLLEQVRTERKVAHLERVLRSRGGPGEEELRTDALDHIDRLVADPGDSGP